MKFVDEFRDPALLKRLLTELRQTASKRWVIMDVCGGQTHSLLKHGLETALGDVLELVHGPGCPVCVTPAETIDDAITLSLTPGVVLATFGDMMRVPGRHGSMAMATARGARIRPVYSPVDAVRLAERDPSQHVVFFGVGFETTAPATALAILQARQLGLSNFSVLAHHVRVEPAMRALMLMPGNRVQGFLAAGHVCTVTGFSHYSNFVDEFRVPVVVTGFEPLDLMVGLLECVRLLERGERKLCNQYSRSARAGGNLHAQRLIDEAYLVATVTWRGFGAIPDGGLVLRPELRQFDARSRFDLPVVEATGDGECRSADVMSGRIKPPDCPLFGSSCSPDTPMGAPMVSSEGTCAAYFRYTSCRGSTHE